jgi:hypothetical protein
VTLEGTGDKETFLSLNIFPLWLAINQQVCTPCPSPLWNAEIVLGRGATGHNCSGQTGGGGRQKEEREERKWERRKKVKHSMAPEGKSSRGLGSVQFLVSTDSCLRASLSTPFSSHCQGIPTENTWASTLPGPHHHSSDSEQKRRTVPPECRASTPEEHIEEEGGRPVSPRRTLAA